jgi:hypothetical protein
MIAQRHQIKEDDLPINNRVTNTVRYSENKGNLTARSGADQL